MRRYNSYGASSFDLLGCPGSYQEHCLIFFLVSGIGWGNTTQTFGISTIVFDVVHMEGA